MKNCLQNDHIIRVTTPARGIASGDALIVGSIFGIATYSSAEGDLPLIFSSISDESPSLIEGRTDEAEAVYGRADHRGAA